MIVNSPTYIKIVCENRTSDIPYCDSFFVEDIMEIRSAHPTSQCCVVRIGIGITWLKRTMMKSMITKSTITACTEANVKYADLITSSYPFVEKIRPPRPPTPPPVQAPLVIESSPQNKAIQSKEHNTSDSLDLDLSMI